MGLGSSIFLIAVGAILKYAVTASISGVELQTVGLILMVVGAIGLLLSLLWMAMASRRRHAVVDGVPAREVVYDDRTRRF